MHDPWQIWNLTASNSLFSIIHILNGLAHAHNKFSDWSDCSLTENSLRLKRTKCNQRYLPCKTEITIHFSCVRETPGFCKALRIQPSAVIPALAAPSPDTGAVLCCMQLVRVPQALVIFRRLSEPEMVSFSLLGGWLLGYLLEFLQMQMKLQPSFSYIHENSIAQHLCQQCSLH